MILDFMWRGLLACERKSSYGKRDARPTGIF